MSLRYALLAALVVYFISLPAQTTRYVAPTAAGLADGSSWANASANLQTMIDASASGDAVWVAAGTYKPAAYPTGCTNCATTRDYAFALKDGVSVYGGFAGTETALAQRNIATNTTILSGDIGTINDITDNCYHVVIAAFANATPTTRLDGFTIIGGNANGSFITVNGLAIYRDSGGGIYTEAGTNTLTNNTLSGNSASYLGGGIYTFSGINTLMNNTLSTNSAYVGGGIYTNAGTNTLTNNTLSGNSASNGGGGISTYYSTNTLTNNTLSGNSSSIGYGGGIFMIFGTNTLTNNTLSGNSALVGGGIFSSYGTNTLTNNIFWGNQRQSSSAYTGADYYADGTNGNTFKNNLLQQASSNYPVSNSGNYAIGTAATGNLFATDPLFVNAADPDGADNAWGTADDGLRLQAVSPLINAGSAAITTPTTDITGYARGAAPFDLGAYEHLPCAGVVRIYVTATGTGSGATWATATNNLQAAIDNACGATEIWVAAGTYKPAAYPTGCSSCATTRDYAFALKDGISVYGGFAGTETALNQRNIATNVTTLSGDIGTAGDNTDNCYHVVLSIADGAATVFDGFTITGGYANSGGQIVVETVTVYSAIGGGAHLNGTSLSIANCTFTGNSASYGGALYHNNNSQSTISQSVFIGNSAFEDGGAIMNEQLSVLNITRCIFASNTAGLSGGAITNIGSTATLNQCVFTGNNSSSNALGGGALYNLVSNVSLFHCTLTANTATNSGGALFSEGNSQITLSNSILWNNTATTTGLAIQNITGSTTSATWSTIEGGYAGTGNISSNPQFTNTANLNGSDNRWMTADDGLRLQAGSPAINAGTNTVAPAMDITGNPRIFDGTVDMGAYEYNPCLGIGSRIYVTTIGTGNGATWATATNNLQAAIDNACGATEIWVKAGTYTPVADPFGNLSPADPRDKTFFLWDGIKLYGGFAGTETALNQRNIAANVTTLSGDIGTAGDNIDNCYHVVLSIADGAATVFDGFTITGGYANSGGQIVVETVTVYRAIGGGAHLNGASPSIANCTFTGNSASYGGALYHNNSQSTISQSVFTGNSAFEDGGAIMNEQLSVLTTTRCIFASNTAGLSGGAITNIGSTATLNQCVFTGNNSSSNALGGGALYNLVSNVSLFHCTLTANTATNSGGALFSEGNSQITLSNSILWNNTATTTGLSIQNITGSTTSAAWSTVEGGYAGTGNISSNPQFVNAADPNGTDNRWMTNDDGLSLQNISPAINAGDPAASPGADILGVAYVGWPDMGAYENTNPCIGITTRMYASATGTGLGASWADATDLQAAINNSCGATEIWVKAGTYLPAKDHTSNASPADPRLKTFLLKNGIQLYGGFAGTETLLNQRNIGANPTVLSGDIGTAGANGDNCYHVVLSVSDVATTVLDGFTIKDGKADNNSTITVEGRGIFLNSGSCMMNEASSPTVANCLFRNNSSTNRGGAMYNNAGANPVITNTVFASNYGGYGGAILNDASSPVLTNCVMTGLTSLYGGAIFSLNGGNPSLKHCTLHGNYASINGGAMYNDGTVSILTNCIIWGNTSGGVAGIFNTVSASYSLIQGGVAGTGNSSADPLLLNPTDPDGADNVWLTADDGLRLACGSPAINAGTNVGVTATADATGVPRTRFTTTDMGAYESLMATLTAPQAVAGASMACTADAECTDQSGWTHYYASATNDVLLSVRKNGNEIGAVGDGTFAVSSSTTPNWGSNTGTTISAPYVDNPQWFTMNRWWNVTATQQPTTDVSVRTYYTAQDLADVNGSLGSNAITATQMRFYKINGGNASLTVATPHDGIGIASAYHASGYWDYTNAPVASTTQWAMGTNADGAAYAEYVIASFSGGGGGGGAGGTGAFPVEWLDFTAIQTQVNGALAASLQWITGVETNVAAFEVERSLDGATTWLNIGNAQPHNTNGTHAYVFTDTELATLSVETVYYRIRSVDIDGSVSHSHIATLSVQRALSLAVYPNPVQGQLSIQVFTSNPTRTEPLLTLYDPLGRILLQQSLQPSLNQVDLQGLSQGLYPWRVTMDGQTYTGTIVKE